MLSTWGSHLARARRSIKQEAGSGSVGVPTPRTCGQSQPASHGSRKVRSVAINEIHGAGRLAGFFVLSALESILS